MKFRIFIILLFLPLTCYAAGEDHLVPDISIYAAPSVMDYDILVSRVFGKEIPYAASKMIAIPSFTNEYAIAFHQENNICKVMYLETKYHLWLYESYKEDKENVNDPEMKEMLSELPDDPYKVPIIIHNASLEKDVYDRLTDVWNKTLLNTKYPEITDTITLTADGTTYHFSTWIFGYEPFSGKTWSPDSSTTPGKLVALADAIGTYARENNSTNKKKLNE